MRNHAAQLAIVKQMTGRNRAAQLAIVKLMSRDDRVSPSNSGSIPGLGRSPGKGNGYPLQYSGLETSMDCIVRGVAKRQK